ncbi:molybdenum cofactor biosynthesis protein 1 b [Colletotrichum musicola]|uniref:Molybdenum cofactor biosynthesis protein 1 b n=1 Tax=Colletotrichum musicola TaxID=2175873 RepID=A0A8H6K4H8_9PEZI|nr:molybdenum cofactor biosynthesis protein 1 b [Colletotrichum musicola]
MERCKFRCLYRVPEEGLPLPPARELLLLTYEIRANARRDTGALWPYGLKELCSTTNGLSLHRKVDGMIDAFELSRHSAGTKFKINCVVMCGRNNHNAVLLVEMTRDKDVNVGFIEYMAFDGNRWMKNKMLGCTEMLDAMQLPIR